MRLSHLLSGAIDMRMRAFWSALAVSAGMATVSFGQITGKVTLEGKPPEMKEIVAVKTNPQCAAQHKNPVFEEKVVAGDNGELANAVVHLTKSADGKEVKGPVPSKPAVLDQKGCMYTP